MTPKRAPCPFFVEGEWTRPKLEGTPVYNLSTGEVIAKCPVGGASEIAAPVEAAAIAFPARRDTPVIERAKVKKGVTTQSFDAATDDVWRK